MLRNPVKIFLTIMLLTINVAGVALADDSKVINATCRILEGLVEADGKTGPMIEVLRAIEKKIDYKIVIHSWGAARAVEDFFAGKYDLLCPVSESEQPPERVGMFIRTVTIFPRIDYFFYKKDGPDLSTIEAAKGKTIGAIRSAYETWFKSHYKDGEVKISWVKENIQNALKISSGRLDLALMNKQTGTGSIKNAGLEGVIIYDPSKPMINEDAFFALQNNDRGKMLNSIISKAITELREEGFIKKLGLE
jgi:ABC-type amino acid transport substrate-binding protein